MPSEKYISLGSKLSLLLLIALGLSIDVAYDELSEFRRLAKAREIPGVN
jgi:hypothetical protein